MGVFILLTPGFPQNEEDSTCLPAFQQFALSVKEIYPELEFIIVSLQYPFEKKKYQWNGIPVYAIGGSNKPGIYRLRTWLKAYLLLRRLHKKKKIKGILSLWLSECSLVAKYFVLFSSIKHFMWLIGQDAKQSNQYIKRINPKGSSIIAMSDFLKQEYFKNHKQLPFMVAENGINLSVFPSLNSTNRPIDILGVGSLIPLKNYKLFIEIIKEISLKLPKINAVIAGSGIEEEDLKQLVIKLGLEKNISFAGHVSHHEILELMNQAKSFLHTSNYEGNSTVLMEALYSGCYTYSTQALSDSETEHLTVLNSRSDFVRALLNCLNNNELVYKRVCFNTMHKSAEKIMSLFLN